jgi:hypothetical protein
LLRRGIGCHKKNRGGESYGGHENGDWGGCWVSYRGCWDGGCPIGGVGTLGVLLGVGLVKARCGPEYRVKLYGVWAVGLCNIDGWRNLRTHGGLIRFEKMFGSRTHTFKRGIRLDQYVGKERTTQVWAVAVCRHRVYIGVYSG